MARTGTFGGFPFDPEVFSGYVSEPSYLKTAIIASGIIREDNTIRDLIGTSGNVGTMPLYVPMDYEEEGNEALNYDGMTNNTPIETSGKKQTFMSVLRMKAWKAKDFTRELTGADPIGDIGRKVGDYYQQAWQHALMAIMEGVEGVAGLETHKTNLAKTEGTIEESDKIGETTLIELGQKALGDMADRFRLVIMHSVVYTRLSILKLINYSKYTIPGAIVDTVDLPTYNGKIIVVDDRGTVDTSISGYPKYKTIMAGEGAFLTCPRDLDTPYYVDYDPETFGGVEMLYTKQGRVLHPNGLSIIADNIAKESPTDAELKNPNNWKLVFNHKNVPLAFLYTNG